MDRARITLLALCALLTTTIDPFEVVRDDGLASQASIAPANAPDGSRSDADADATSVVVAAADAARDATVAQQILDRLAIRHTALSRFERHELARTIIREARAHDLDPGLVVAVIEVESAGYHLAVSHVGAMGLMQLLPSTGKELAERMEIDWKGPDTLFDPTINVKLGTAYLRQLADRYGNVHTALAAYNWGPGRIDRRLRRGATVPSLYIKQVMRAVDRNAMLASARS